MEKVAPLQRGFDLPTQNLVEGIYPVIYSNGILQHHDKYKCEAPGLITGRSGTIGKFTYIDSGFYWPHNTSLWVTDFCGNCPKFIYYLYQTVHIEQFSTGSGVPTLNRNDVHRYKTSVPTAIVEQEKIAKFLSILDERIVTQNKIIEKYESLIKGLNNILLYGTEGKYVCLGDILLERSERSRTNNQHEVLSSTVKGIFSQREYFSKDIASENNVGYKIIRLHDVVLSPQNLWMGNINYNDRFDIGIVSPSYKVFSIADGYDNQFVAAMLKTYRALYSYMMVSEQGASIVRRNLNMEAFLQLVFKIPSLDKQREIGCAISLLKSQLKTANKIIRAYTSQKKYLLRQMFI
ncbi:restriction endonuclease subunit S [Bacteroides fragilis]|nr:restriction endonuclease subunit S [Bacteroides fragilis]MCE9228251.1 restriction endonuclease subunit S [Bacteroides fragilis]MCE9478355.1 restriction endonuclease subunit S [Bacteroides fragilis]RHM56332.1 restriction endonuclease subunit S [Bacteroides fragilis]